MGFPISSDRGWYLYSQPWKPSRHVNEFYVYHRGWKMWFINIPKHKYISLYWVSGKEVRGK